MCKCARRCAPPGEGPGGAAAGGGRAAPLRPPCRRVLPVAAGLVLSGYLPPMPRAGGGGRGRAPGPGPAAPGAPLSLRLALGFRQVAGGTAASAPSLRAIESGLTVRALGGSAGGLGPRPRGQRLLRRAWRPPAESCGGFEGRGLCWAPPPWLCLRRRRARAPAPCRPLRRPRPRPPRRLQEARAPVAMVTAAPVNERLSDMRAPVLPDVGRGRAARGGRDLRHTGGRRSGAGPEEP